MLSMALELGPIELAYQVRKLRGVAKPENV
jgi:hypothetical protein